MIALNILEDITLGVQRQKDWETPGGLGPLAECMFMNQRYDIGVICVTHTLSGTSPVIRQNAETIITTNLSGENTRLICDTFNITPEQADRLKTLKRGEFAILNLALWDKCVCATFEKPLMSDNLEESDRRDSVENFMKKVKVSTPVPLSAFQPTPALSVNTGSVEPSNKPTLQPEQLEMLVIIARGKRHMCEIYHQMGLSRTKGRRITKRLEAIGAIILHTIPTGRRGGRYSFPELTDHGWNILSGIGTLHPKPKTGGGFEHELAACLIEAHEQTHCRTVRFEVDIGGKRVDGESIDLSTGERTLFNIGVTDPVREATNIEAILKLPALQTSKFMFVARDKAFAGEVEKVLKAKDTTGNLLSHVEMKTIADYVE